MNEANKQLILQNKIANKKQWELEIVSQEKQLKNIKRIMEIFDRQRILQKQSADIMFSNFELLKPNWKFETIKGYMDAQRELQLLGQETKEMEYEGIVASRNTDYEKIKIQRDELKKALENLDKDIVELSKKGE
jgi:hypothetical protein